MNLHYSGLAVEPTSPPSMAVVVQPGELIRGDRKITVSEETQLPIRLGGQRRYLDQYYKMRGEGTVLPSWWNGEDIRGSGGTPYQRMVPGTLAVYSNNRDIQYTPDTDYTYDFYYGTIKRHPQGRIKDGEELSLDYSVWLCRYDAIVLGEDGTLSVVEGDSDAPDSRELLLPEPPEVKDGFVLAHIFTGWGQDCVYGGNSALVTDGLAEGVPQAELTGRYDDMVRRTYFVEVSPGTDGDGQQQPQIRFGATGEDYGTAAVLTEETLRWTKPKPFEWNAEIPLTMQVAYRFETDWGLGLRLTQPAGGETPSATVRLTVDAVPEMIFDLRPLLGGLNPLDLIPMEQLEHLDGFKAKLESGKPTRIAFFGESASRSGLWLYQAMSGLRAQYPGAKIFSSNVAVGGEQSVQGIHRLEKEVLSLNADLIVLEYMINDACSGYTEQHIEDNVRTILGRILDSGAACLVLMVGGVNPQFTSYGSKRNLFKFYELYRRLSKEYNVAYVGGYNYFANMHQFGKYYIADFKGNMVNHTFGNEDINWGPFDRILSDAIVKALES